MKPDARRFVLLVLGLTAGLTGGLALLNLTVDPYNRFGHNRLGVYISAERECKSAYVVQYPHDALLMGNSREIRIPPAELKGFQFFNGAFSGATAEEMYYFIEHFARPERLVVLAIDLGAQDPAELRGDIFAPKGFTSALDNLLNLQTTEYSIRTISESLGAHPEPIGRDGLVPVGSWIREADRDDPGRTAYVVKAMQRTWAGYHCPARAQLSWYVRISECLRARGIPCVVVLPPLHETVAQTVRNGPAGAELAAWKRELITIFPHVIDLSFSPYNAATNFYRADPLHFKADVGVQFMSTEVLPFAARVLGGTNSAAAVP